MADNAAAIRAYIQGGGGMLSGAQAWYWSYTKDVDVHPTNVLLGPMGAYISNEDSSTDFTFGASPPSQIGNADVALASLVDTYAQNTSRCAAAARRGSGARAAPALQQPPDAPHAPAPPDLCDSSSCVSCAAPSTCQRPPT